MKKNKIDSQNRVNSDFFYSRQYIVSVRKTFIEKSLKKKNCSCENHKV